jgi:acetyl-CoA acetyltransferase
MSTTGSARRDVAVVAYSQTPFVPKAADHNEVELVMPAVHDVLERTGLDSQRIGFTVSGSNDYLMGQPFSFVSALDGVGAWPPIEESHVEMDGAWALYEAWVRLQHGDIDTALVYAFGKSSSGDLGRVLSLQLEPYTTQPLWPEPDHLAAIQARLCLEGGVVTHEQMAEVAARSNTNGFHNDAVATATAMTAAEVAGQAMAFDPLRPSDIGPVADGAAAIVLAAGDTARDLSDRPAWISGIAHRIESHAIGTRDLTTSASTRLAAQAAGVGDPASIELAELYAPYSHQEVLLAEAIGLRASADINPSGGALAAHPLMVAGLARIGEAAERITNGDADRAVAHATAGPCLQQNLVAVLEGTAR